MYSYICIPGYFFSFFRKCISKISCYVKDKCISVSVFQYLYSGILLCPALAVSEHSILFSLFPQLHKSLLSPNSLHCFLAKEKRSSCCWKCLCAS